MGRLKEKLFIFAVCSLLGTGCMTVVAADNVERNNLESRGNISESGSKDFTLDAVSNISVKNIFRTVQIKWDAVEGAGSYKVYQEMSDGSLKEIGITTRTSYEINNVPLSDKIYKYKVSAISVEDDLVESELSESVSIKIQLETPKLSQIKIVSGNKIHISWKPVDYAEGYVVYRKETGEKTWRRLTKTYTNELEYVDDTVKQGKRYCYTVRARNANSGKDYQSPYDKDGIGIQIGIEQPRILSAAVTSSSNIKLNWNSVEGAEKYRVYVKVGNLQWKTLEDVKGTSYNCKINNIAWGWNVQLKVRAISETGTNSLSSGYSVLVKPQKVKVLKTSPVSYNSNKVSWQTVKGVSGYKVYRKGGTGGWKYIKNINSGNTSSYTDNQASVGSSYYYTVKAYWSQGNKIQDGIVDGVGLKVKTEMSAPSVSVSPNGLGIKINWGKAAGAQGYVIYKKAGNAKNWTRLGSVGGYSTTSYIDKNVRANTEYSYTVRGYRKTGKSTYLGRYDTSGKKTRVNVTTKTMRVTDKNSGMYGKYLKLYYDGNGKLIQNLENIVGKKDSYYLYINKAKSMITAYYKDGSYYVPYKAMVCSTGAVSSYTPNGTFLTQAKYRWHELMGPSWGQWCTRIHGGILFHSVFYNSRNNNNALSVSAYNKLGSPASHGCVRVTAADAKWIYDNCKLRTTVVIYGKTGYEPLKKPSSYKLSSWHTWDPTDPNMKYKCKQKGCH
ncbi:Exoglucanase B precursor [uncultured Roseburia sp.]|uniref:L,D-transpeptidase family protein n=1 Tax=Brotonthovivens ammoniilytica TaxID=2981725 RepID=A0ABT2TKH9_9FIRM|nr:L,D-transpeptidase family protein [Brotonthovivens ammoniilytica]MCU6762666.1 L,D-transpeptidase family protein [Brotonthovivens ammoniilytica]SCI84054.1 Exoglucanase B precursor [uncultured Roseburia sp.]